MELVCFFGSVGGDFFIMLHFDEFLFDVNGDGVADYRTGPTVTRGPGMAYGAPAYGGAYGRRY